MKNFNWNGVLAKLALVGAVGAYVGVERDASAAASCLGAGYLCFYDYSTAQYGNLFGNNANWGDFGWNDRADIARNDGVTSNACLYEHINYGGWVGFIPRNTGWWDIPDNTISSNRWTTGPTIDSCR